MARLILPQVTLCAVSSVNLEATIRALEICTSQVDFAACKLFTDVPVRPSDPSISVVPIEKISSSIAYSKFILGQLGDHIETSHCLVVQWDGHIIDSHRWRPEFLEYDYIGATWPQFHDSNTVGNGGFSLRSNRLMNLCKDPNFRGGYPEDIAIGRENRGWLEANGIRFAPPPIADAFSTERAGDLAVTFGYHGAWLMPQVIGPERFWDIYQSLNDRTSIRHDFPKILRQMSTVPEGWRRALSLMYDQIIYPRRGMMAAIMRQQERDYRT